MSIKLAFFVCVAIGLQIVHGDFMSECELGVIDFGKEFMKHIEDNFPEVTKSTSREMTTIYSYAIRLVTNNEEESQLNQIYDGIGAYLKVCNQLFDFNTTLHDSMESIEAELNIMKVDEVCQKPPEKVKVFKEILGSTFVSKILTLEYFETSFYTLVAGAAKAISSIVKSALCIIKDCTQGVKAVFKESIGDILFLAKSFLADILTDIQSGLERLFKGHFVKLQCKVDKEFEASCDVLNAEVEDIKHKLNRQLRNYQDCLDDKSRIAKKLKDFRSMKILLKL